MKVVGLDSSSHLGLVLLEEGEEARCRAITTKLTGFPRLQLIAREMGRVLSLWKPDFVVMERYAFCRNIDVFITLVEIGTLVKMSIHEFGIECIDVPPTVVKEYATGKGTAQKDDMKAAAAKWGFHNDNHDIVDAYWLARMGKMGKEELKSFLTKKKKKKKG